MPEMTREAWEGLNQRYAEITIKHEQCMNAIRRYMTYRAQGDIEQLEEAHDAFALILAADGGFRSRHSNRPRVRG